MAKFLFVTDLDNTLVGDDQALAQLNDRLQQHRQEYGTSIVYATGRSPVLYQELKQAKNLLDPDALVSSVGTEIYIDGSSTPDSAWSEQISSGWNRDRVLTTTIQFPDLKPQPNSEQRPLKVSFFLEQSSAAVLPHT